jgi:WXG100 protein secretion system (Wss), protein YukD
MPDIRCLVTVVGTRREVDLALPAQAPIADYVLDLVELCGESEDVALPPAWSLGYGLGPVLPPHTTLAAAGVADGDRLHLRDALGGEDAEPVVREMAEMVVAAAPAFRWDARSRSAAAMGFGLVWMIAAAVALSARERGTGPGAVLGAAGTAVALLLLGVAARRRAWPLPGALRVLLPLGAVPCAAVVGATLAGAGVAGDGWSNRLVGALLGAAVASAAAACVAPGLVTFTVLPVTALAAIGWTALHVMHASAAEAEAVLVLAGYAALCILPSTAARLVSLTGQTARTATWEDEGTIAAAVKAARLWVGVFGGLLAIAVAVGLVLLNAGAGVYGPALAGCIAVSALLRIHGRTDLAEVLPLASAGAVGLFSGVYLAAGQAGTQAAAAVGTLGVGLGAAAVAVGVLLAFRRPAVASGVDERAGQPGAHGWPGTLSILLGAAALPLLLGVFGVYGYLVGLHV